MNKSELVLKIASKTRMTKTESERALNSFVEIIVSHVKAGEKVSISGLGIFEKQDRKERNGVNPGTGERVLIPAKSVPKFKAAKVFKDSLL